MAPSDVTRIIVSSVAFLAVVAVGVAAILVYRRIRRGIRPQFGIPELLALPVALAPFIAAAARAGSNIELLFIFTYGASGAALGWAITMQQKGGWIPAVGIIAGAWTIAISGIILFLAILAATGHL